MNDELTHAEVEARARAIFSQARPRGANYDWADLGEHERKVWRDQAREELARERPLGYGLPHRKGRVEYGVRWDGPVRSKFEPQDPDEREPMVTFPTVEEAREWRSRFVDEPKNLPIVRHFVGDWEVVER